MNVRFLTTAAMATALCGVLPARAADSTLQGLMMPDAKVIAGVNVDQAKLTPFGQWVLGQMQPGDKDFQQFTTLTGFDPTRDVHELMVGTAATANTPKGQASGLVAARGTFDTSKIAALVAAHPEAATETYNGVMIYEDAKKTAGFAFLDATTTTATLAVAGDIANVKAAIDRQMQKKPALFPVSVNSQIQSWSTTQDAWVITTVPPSSLAPGAGMPPIPGVGTQPGQSNAFQNIQNLAAGVKFGTNVEVKAQAQAGSATDATQLGDVVKLLASLAQMQSNADPKVTALAQSLKVTTNGPALNISLSLPQDTLVQILKSGTAARAGQTAPRHRAPAKKM